MPDGCKQANCTVAQTGKCLLNNDPGTCPERTTAEIAMSASLVEAVAPLSEPPRNPRFPSSLTLSLDDVSTIMAGSYGRIVGILGAPEAGKTAVLVCLYLLLASNKLKGYEFCDSRSLMALEEISRGARRWHPGEPPGELTVHTENPKERVPGLIHLRVSNTATGEASEIFLSDLPGEWSTSLIDSNRTDRLQFLRSAETIWLMLDGTELTSQARRQTALHRASLLLQRVSTLLSPHRKPISLIISHLDKGNIPESVYAPLIRDASRLGIEMRVFQIASFSEDDGVEPGAGMKELIDSVCAEPGTMPSFWTRPPDSNESRAMMRFRVRA
jgi:hypothetical protein